MRILYVCDKLITFILNEIIELKKRGNDVYILPNRQDSWVTSHVITPILTANGLLGKTFRRSRNYKNRRQKLIFLIYVVLRDFLLHPFTTLKALFYLQKIYPANLGNGTEDYLDIRQLLGLKIDVIHSPFSTPQIIDRVYFLSKVCNAPFTLSFRAHDIYKENVLDETRKRINILQKAFQIITISDYNADYLRSNLGLNRDIEIIHGSVNINVFKPKDELVSNNSIIAVCRIDEQKGLNYLIEACKILSERKIHYECMIIGEGREKRKYEKLIDELQMPNIHFINYLPQDKIREYLNCSTVFVLPCVIAANGTRDILANALKEAMAMQLPVITSNICGIEELVDDGVSGVLVPPEAPESIANAIIMLFSNPDLRKTMGEEGRKKIKRDFNVETEMGKFEGILKKISNNYA